MSENVDLEMLLSKAKKITDRALNLSLDNKYEKSMRAIEKSNKILMVALSEISDSNALDDEPSGKLKTQLETIYQLLAENFDNLKKYSILIKHPLDALDYLKTAEEYLSKYLKLSDNPQRYNQQLSFLYTSAMLYRDLYKPELELEYVRKYITSFYTALKNNFKFDNDLLIELQLTFNLYDSLIQKNPSLAIEGWKLLKKTLNDFTEPDEELSEELELALSMWLPFAINTLDIVATQNPNLVAENESLVFAVMNYIYDFMVSMPEAFFDDQEVLENLLSVFKKYTNLFSTVDSQNRFAKVSVNLFKVILRNNHCEIAIEALKNSINVYESNPEIYSVFRLLQLYMRLIGLHNVTKNPELGRQYYDKVLSLLDSLNPEDTVKEVNTIDYENVEDEINILKTETYYFISSNEFDLNHNEESKKFLQKAKESRAKLSNSEKRNFIRTILDNMINVIDITIQNSQYEDES